MLFKQGSSFLQFPLKIFYMEMAAGDDGLIKAGFGVSSKNFKLAAQRNRIKRLLREAYRTEKSVIKDTTCVKNKSVILFILYIDKQMPDYWQVKDAMKFALDKLLNAL